MPFWVVVRQARTEVEHVFPLSATTEHKAFHELGEWTKAAGEGGELALYDCDPSDLGAFDGRRPVRTKYVYKGDRTKPKVQRALPDRTKAELQELKKAAQQRKKQQEDRREAEHRAWLEPTWKNLYRAWKSDVENSDGRWLLEAPEFTDVPINSPEGHRQIRGEDDPAIEWWPINDVGPRIQALRQHGSSAGFFHGGFEQKSGVHTTARLLHQFRDEPEMRAAVWIGACLWGLTNDRAMPGRTSVKTPLAHELLRAVTGRLHDGGGYDWHHAMSEVLPGSPYARSLADMITPKDYDDYAHLAAVQFIWVRSLFQLVRVFHSETELRPTPKA